VPADFFDIVQYIPAEKPLQQPPPRPPKIPIPARSYPPPGRMRPMSTMTFMTASTKIGEIAESRMPDQIQDEVDSRPVPYTIPPPLEATEPKKKRGFKFWKREDKRQDIAAF
jgi:hypothetical protein